MRCSEDGIEASSEEADLKNARYDDHRARPQERARDRSAGYIPPRDPEAHFSSRGIKVQALGLTERPVTLDASSHTVSYTSFTDDRDGP